MRLIAAFLPVEEKEMPKNRVGRKEEKGAEQEEGAGHTQLFRQYVSNIDFCSKQPHRSPSMATTPPPPSKASDCMTVVNAECSKLLM